MKKSKLLIMLISIIISLIILLTYFIPTISVAVESKPKEYITYNNTLSSVGSTD